MRTLFLTAKKFAIDANAETISLEEFREALSTLEFIDNDAKKLVYEYLKITPKLANKISKSTIEEASKHKQIPFDKQVKEFKQYLEEHGFALNSVVSKIFVKKVNALRTIKEKIAIK